jgi:hypothetical protein
LTRVNADLTPTVYFCTNIHTGENQTSERIMVIENIKWALIAVGIWFSIYHAATVIGITPLF